MKTTNSLPITWVPVLAIVLVWMLLVGVAITAGAFHQEVAGLPLAVIIAVAGPPLLFLLMFAVRPRFRTVIHALDLRPLILLHSFRMLGLGFVFLYAHKELAGWFALPAGLGDAVAAAWAWGLGVTMYRREVSRRAILAWNHFGLLDFVVAIITGVTGRSSMAFIHGPPFTDGMESFPLVVVPAFLVPFFTVTHLIVYLRLSKIKQ